MMGLSFALIVASSVLPSASLDEAYNQLKIIDSVRTKYLTYEHLQTRIQDNKIDFFTTNSMYEPTPNLKKIERQISDKLIFLIDADTTLTIGSTSWRHTRRTKGAKRKANIFTNTPSLLALHNLDNFQKGWNFLHNAHNARIKEIKFEDLVGFQSGEKVDMSNYLRSRPSEFVSAILLSTKFGILEKKHLTRSFTPPEWLIVIEIAQPEAIILPFDEIHIPIQVSFSEKIGAQSIVVPPEDSTVPLGEYESAFGDLKALTKGLESMDITPLLDYIRHLRNESDKNIQLLGIEIPRTIVSQWGITLLIAFQGYFLLHFNHTRFLTFSRDVLDTFPWIGLYSSKTAKITFLFSSSLLPISASSLLLWNGASLNKLTVNITLLLVSAISSFLLAGYTTVNIWKFRHQLEKGCLDEKLELANLEK